MRQTCHGVMRVDGRRDEAKRLARERTHMQIHTRISICVFVCGSKVA